MKKLLFVLVLLAVGFAGVAYWMSQKANAVALPPRHEPVDKGAIVEQVNATGKLIYKDIFIVASPELPGRIVEVYPEAEVGKHVTAGAPLIKLDDEIAKAKMEAAQAELAAAQSLEPQAKAKLEEAKSAIAAAEALEKAAEAKKLTAEAQVRLAQAGYDLAAKENERALANKENLTADKLDAAAKAVKYAKEGITVAEAQVKGADADILAAQANVQKAKAGLAEANAAIQGAKSKAQQAQTAVTAAKLSLDMTTVKATADGTILEKKIIKGQMIAPQGTPVLFTLAPDLGRLELRAQVGESDIRKVSMDMRATFTVDAFTDDSATFEGKVIRIANVPTTVSTRDGLPAITGPVFYEVLIDVAPRPTGVNATRSLKAGYTANVDLVIKKVENVLRVPTAAFNYRPDPLDPEEQKLIAEKAKEQWKPLWTWTSDKQKSGLVFVHTGANDGTKTEIKDVFPEGAIKEGTQIIIEGPPSAESRGLFDSPARIRL